MSTAEPNTTGMYQPPPPLPMHDARPQSLYMGLTGGRAHTRPLSRSYFFMLTLIVAIIGWGLALVGQSIVTANIGNGPIGVLWFAILLQTTIIVSLILALHSITLPLHTDQLSNLISIAIVFAVIGVNANIFSSDQAQKVTAAGWLITAIIDIFWLLYLTSAEGAFIRSIVNRIDGASTTSSSSNIGPSRHSAATEADEAAYANTNVATPGRKASSWPRLPWGPKAQTPPPMGPTPPAPTSPSASIPLSHLAPVSPGPRTTSTSPLPPPPHQTPGTAPKSRWGFFTRRAQPPPGHAVGVPSNADGLQYSRPYSTGSGSGANRGSGVAENRASDPRYAHMRGSGTSEAARVGSGFSDGATATGGSQPDTAHPVSVGDEGQGQEGHMQADGGGEEQHYQWEAEALYGYRASDKDPNELTFKKGEILHIVDKSGKWWEARTQDGRKGIAPSNYLRLL